MSLIVFLIQKVQNNSEIFSVKKSQKRSKMLSKTSLNKNAKKFLRTPKINFSLCVSAQREIYWGKEDFSLFKENPKRRHIFRRIFGAKKGSDEQTCEK